MKFTLLITACYIPWYVELVEFKSHIVAAQESSSESNCELRTYPSSFLNGGCAECPENCEHEYHEDLEPCIKACEKEPSPTTPKLQVQLQKPSESKETSLSRTEQVEKSEIQRVHRLNIETSKFTAAKQVAIVIGVLGSLILLLTALIVLLWRNLKKTQETECSSEAETIRIAETRVRFTEYHSSDMDLKETYL